MPNSEDTEYIYFPALKKIVCLLIGHRFVKVKSPLEPEYEVNEWVCTRCGRASATIIFKGE